MGIVYVLSNPAFDNYVKVGRTIDLEQRLKQLDNTSEPPHLNWSSAMFRKRRTDNDEQTTEAGRDYHEVEAS